MEDPTTIALNLTFLGTLGVALVMFFGLFLVFVATLVIAGLGRLAAVTIMAVGRGLMRTAGRADSPAEAFQQDRPARAVGTTQNARPPKAAKPVKAAKPAKPAKPLRDGLELLSVAKEGGLVDRASPIEGQELRIGRRRALQAPEQRRDRHPQRLGAGLDMG